MIIGCGAITLPSCTANQLSGFNGNFASLFTPGTVLQSVQSDLGITYGGTPLATAGNTSTTALTLTGSLATTPVPIWVRATNSSTVGGGATFNVYYDGAGLSPAMIGVTPSVGTPVALTGAGAGLSLTWSAGSTVTNDSWKATVSAWADQSGNGKNYSQATASKQPIMTVGLGGYAGVAADGIDDVLISNFDLPAPGTTPTFIWGVYRVLANATPGTGCIVSDTGVACILYMTVGTHDVIPLAGVNGSPGLTGALGTWNRSETLFSNSTADYMKMGSAAPLTGVSYGNNDPGAQRAMFATTSGSYLAAEMLTIIHASALPSIAQRAALSAAVTAKYGGSVLV